MDISTTAASTVQATLASSVNEDAPRGSSASKTTASTPSVSTLNAMPVINPLSHIDPALGIVVAETYNTTGVVVDQYPTRHMMLQYSLYGLSDG
ncbi:MAG: hypothetical protein ABF876_16075 [Acetobacter aceti]|uniref:Uncharacterized protein n=1 Tax=Acetobacter aceti TaxID=435 RepID=A0A1U9KEF9_ACEAC|nr:hypothetical protein [Acetobacter aceti]AQS84185.1 hypothetical protein A0U92_04690 [Acetobacter aceti]